MQTLIVDNMIYLFSRFQTYAVSGLLQNIPPIRRDGKSVTKKRDESNRAKEDGKEDEREEKRRSLLQTKFIKDPERRFYYYIERK